MFLAQASQTPMALEGLLLFFLIAALIERVVEFIIGIVELFNSSISNPTADDRLQKIKMTASYGVGIVLGITICWLGKLDIFSSIGFKIPEASSSLFIVLSGIVCGGGSQFVHEWVAIAGYKKDTLKLEKNKP